MSVGILKHPLFGEVRTYILNNKNVLEVAYKKDSSAVWFDKYSFIREQMLTTRKIRYYLTPLEVYAQQDRQSDEDAIYDSRSKEHLRIAIYDHFVVTLRAETEYRQRNKEPFTLSELWFFMHALAKGILQLIEVQERFGSMARMEVNPENVLLNEYGFIKMIGYCSTPFDLAKVPAYQAPEHALPRKDFPLKDELTCSFSLGRILASLILLEDLGPYCEPNGNFNQARLLKSLQLHKDEVGILHNIVLALMNENTNERLKVSELLQIMKPYEPEILELKDFEVVREVCRESMADLSNSNK